MSWINEMCWLCWLPSRLTMAVSGLAFNLICAGLLPRAKEGEDFREVCMLAP
jgi:hypothetical protein